MDAPARTGAAMPRYYFHQHLNGLLIPIPTVIVINIFALWRRSSAIIKVTKELSGVARQDARIRSVGARRRYSALVESFSN
jgi:hypothetical protein